jgi:uncharacterized protein YgiM (DUF1202 family)
MPGIRVRYEVQYPNPIEVRAGERVEVGRQDEDNPAWFWCRASDGREGWMPTELLSRKDSLATVLEDYSAKELAVDPGEEVLLEQVRHGWALVRNAKGQRGWIPESCLGD